MPLPIYPSRDDDDDDPTLSKSYVARLLDTLKVIKENKDKLYTNDYADYLDELKLMLENYPTNEYDDNKIKQIAFKLNEGRGFSTKLLIISNMQTYPETNDDVSEVAFRLPENYMSDNPKYISNRKIKMRGGEDQSATTEAQQKSHSKTQEKGKPQIKKTITSGHQEYYLLHNFVINNEDKTSDLDF